MISFDVQDMSCGHCVAAITQALQQADPGARVRIDLPAHRVQVDDASASADTLAAAIRDAGYTPQAVASCAGDAPRAGGCCGGCHAA